MSFLYPTYLWAFIGLALPIAIHLWSKKEGKVIKIGSVRLLQEADSKQSNSIQLNELLLLVLRCLIITMVVLILAEPQYKNHKNKTDLTYLIDPTLATDDSFHSIADSLQSYASTKLLAPGFPEYDLEKAQKLTNQIPNYWHLAHAMNQLKTDSIVVLTSAHIKGIQGKRPKVAMPMDWIVVNSDVDDTETILDIYKHDDSLTLLTVRNRDNRLELSKRYVRQMDNDLTFNASKDSVQITWNDTKGWHAISEEQLIHVDIVYADSLQQDAHYLEAALRAISDYSHLDITINKTKTYDASENNSDLLIWLSFEPIPESSAKFLLLKEDPLATSLITFGSTKDEFYVTQSLNAENSVTDNLPEQLLSILDPYKNLNQKISTYDERIMDKTELMPRITVDTNSTSQASLVQFTKWLWLILVLLCLVERIIAKLRKQ